MSIFARQKTQKFSFQFFSAPGKKLHSTLENTANNNNCKQQVWDKRTGNIKSISVNDLLDQHLSKLTLGLEFYHFVSTILCLSFCV